MAETISIVCSNCQKAFNVPATLKGKRIRCKSCGQALAVEERAAPAASRPAAKPKQADDEEWTASVSGYGVKDEKVDVIRCPHCAGEIPDQSIVVCMECGYNLRTREKMDTKVLEPATVADYMIWHLPGAGNALLVFGLTVLTILIWTEIVWVKIYCFTTETEWGRAYITVFFLFAMFFAGRFAYRRFFINPHPPDREKRLKKEDA